MSSESGAQKRARKQTQAAVSTLQGGQTQFMQDPLFQGIQQIAAQVLGQPLTMGPDQVARMNANAAQTAHAGARGTLEQGMGRLAASGSGTRGGSANRLLAETSAQLGADLAQGSRQAELQAALQRYPDLLNAMNMVSQTLGQEYGWTRDISQAQLGAGQILGGLAGQPTPLAQGLGGLGALGGTLLGAASPGGGSVLSGIVGKGKNG